MELIQNYSDKKIHFHSFTQEILSYRLSAERQMVTGSIPRAKKITYQKELIIYQLKLTYAN